MSSLRPCGQPPSDCRLRVHPVESYAASLEANRLLRRLYTGVLDLAGRIQWSFCNERVVRLMPPFPRWMDSNLARCAFLKFIPIHPIKPVGDSAPAPFCRRVET